MKSSLKQFSCELGVAPFLASPALFFIRSLFHTCSTSHVLLHPLGHFTCPLSLGTPSLVQDAFSVLLQARACANPGMVSCDCLLHQILSSLRAQVQSIL